MLKPNDIVMIYEDPCSERYQEGSAALVSRKDAFGGEPKAESWEVRFIGETETYFRCIRRDTEPHAILVLREGSLEEEPWTAENWEVEFIGEVGGLKCRKEIL